MKVAATLYTAQAVAISDHTLLTALRCEPPLIERFHQQPFHHLHGTRRAAEKASTSGIYLVCNSRDHPLMEIKLQKVDEQNNRLKDIRLPGGGFFADHAGILRQVYFGKVMALIDSGKTQSTPLRLVSVNLIPA